MKIKFLLFSSSLSLIPQLSLAQCVATQDCAVLGYTETSCPNGNGIKCPFGNKWACPNSDDTVCTNNGFKYSCTGDKQNGGYGAPCNGKYAACNCIENYQWNNGTCVIDTGPAGDVYYCKGKVTGVKTSDMNFYVALDQSSSYCGCSSSYKFCDGISGKYPNNQQLLQMSKNKNALNQLFSTYGGKSFTSGCYWSSQYGGPSNGDSEYDCGSYVYCVYMGSSFLSSTDYNASPEPCRKILTL